MLAMSLSGLLAEGFESALLACSLILLLPGAAVGLTARAAAIPAISSFSVGVLALSWLRFSERGGGHPALLVATALMLGTILLLVPMVSRLDLAAIPAGLLIGAGVAELWLPCVGQEFGALLGELPARGASGLGLLALYLLGTLSPLIVLAALHHLTPDRVLERLEPAWAVLGGVLLTLLALATALGFHDDLVGKLLEWSVA
jgi:cytochrome c biogenesis protein CcdA